MKNLTVFLLLFMTACGSPTMAPASTVDPFVALAQAQQTNEASADQMALLSGQLTATAQAPIVAITSTAAALSVAQTMAADARTSTAISWTATPSATFTPIPTATVNLQATVDTAKANAETQKLANDVVKDNLSVERAQNTNTILSWAPYVIGLAVLLVLIMAGVAMAMRLSITANPIDAKGNPMPMINVVNGVAWDIDRSPNGLTIAKPSYLKQLPAITAARQDATTARDQAIDAIARAPSRAPRLPGALPAGLPQLDAPDLLQTPAFLPPVWEIIEGWEGDKGIPYGVNERGLQTFSIADNPHTGVLGFTGAGKSRRLLRPLVACALAAGHRVVILGKSADFWPFENHPNVAIATVRDLTNDQEALRYVRYLKSIVEEMNRRDEYLTSVHKSTWEQAGREATFVVLDEMTNALDLMPREFAHLCRRLLSGLIKEGRKVGLHVIFAAQRAVGIREIITQVGRAVFTMKDEQESRFALGVTGAERLRKGYFYSTFDKRQLVGAFEPSDEEIQAFLLKRPARALEKIDFIDAKFQEDPPALRPAAKPAKSLTDDQVQLIKDMQGESLTAIVRRIWGSGGGDAFSWRSQLVKDVLASLQNPQMESEAM
jgi:hypothetical protein